MNKKEGIIVGILLTTTFITGAYADSPVQQVLKVFVTNFPKVSNVTVTNFPQKSNVSVTNFPNKSHLGQDISSHVALRCDGGSPAPAKLNCLRILHNGTDTATFDIPARKVLVVTDVSWLTGTTLSAGSLCFFEIRLKPSTSNLLTFQVFASSAVAAPSVLAGEQLAAASEHMTTGFVVSSGTEMWVESCGSSAGFSSTAWLEGYLATAP